MAEIIIFEDHNFRGSHRHLYQSEPNLDHSDDNSLNDRVSSFVVTSGRWQFFRDDNYKGIPSPIFGVGLYANVEMAGIPNDSVTAVKLISA